MVKRRKKSSSCHGLGRIYLEDKRDKSYPLKTVLPKKSKLTKRFWDADGFWGDQNGYPYCVGYGWSHWLADGPVVQKNFVDPTWIYKEARKTDDIPGENYEGTTVRAGAKVLQKAGYISNYYWASNINEVILAVLEKGPVTVGTNWYENMNEVDSSGFIKPSGNLSGGHCYVINGVDTEKGFFRIKNSWGRTWGNVGFAYISISDMSTLLSEQGEVCLATEIIPEDQPIEPETPSGCFIFNFFSSLFK